MTARRYIADAGWTLLALVGVVAYFHLLALVGA